MTKNKAIPASQLKNLLKKSNKPHKYRAQKTNGFDSAKEAKRAKTLQLLQKSGAIQNLQFQVKYPLAPKFEVPGINNKPVCVHRALSYTADFVYTENNQTIVEDCKGFRTKEYRKKKNLMKRIYGIDIRES